MRRWTKLAPLALLIGLAQAPAHGAVTYSTGAGVSNIPGLTGFATTGAMMDSLSVTATFLSGSETRLWADIDPDSGGVSGTGWSLRVDGDTFGAPWQFTNTRTIGATPDKLTTLVLDGRNALTVFDRSFGGLTGTPGSALGQDFVCASTSVCADNQVRVLYDFLVSVGANAAIGDLWQTVTIQFCGPNSPAGNCQQSQGTLSDGLGGNWSFLQDTDNDSRLLAPEPGSLALVGLALGVVGGWLRRRRNSAT